MRGLRSFPPGGTAAIIGASGAIGGAVADAVEASGAFARTVRLSRRTDPPLDLADEASIEAAAALLKDGPPLRLVFCATGFLHGDGLMPEKSLRRITAEGLERNFRVNAIGPALLLKHLCPLLPREGRSVLAIVTAKVGSIADNGLGGWYSYRASKAAQNQLVRTASIEVARTRPESVLIALHPGTVASELSEPFGKDGLTVRPPAESAAAMLNVVVGLTPADTGTFRGYDGATIPW